MVSATEAGPSATCVVVIHTRHCSNSDRLEPVEVRDASEVIWSVVLTLFPPLVLLKPQSAATYNFRLILCVCTAVLEDHSRVPTSLKHCQENAALWSFQTDSGTSLPHTVETIIVHSQPTIDVQFTSIIRTNVESVASREFANV
jgi:hypothetical protein